MKKLTVSLFVLVLILVLAGCTLKQPQETTLPSGTTAAPTEAGCSHTYAAATCTAPKTCTSCGATEGEAKGHTPVTDPAVAASCITTGKTEGSHCSTCSAVLSEQAFLPANGHTFVDGKCSICDSLEPSEGLKLTLHESGEYYIVTGRGTCEDTDIIFPNVYNGLPVRVIGTNCFEGRDWFDSVIIQEGITKIEQSAFEDCNRMTSVTIPDSVNSIGKRAFLGCMALRAVKIPEGVTNIHESTFECCYILSSVDLPDSVRFIGKSAFAHCLMLSSINLDHIRVVREGAFESCGFSSLELPDCLLEISPRAFENCGQLTSLTIPDNVTNIGDGAFRFCFRLRSVVIPESVTNIGKNAFADCNDLTSLTIPVSVTGLGEGVFRSSDGLSRINYAGTVAQWKETELQNRKWKIDALVTEVICTDGSVTY